jgi:formate dehydrogenase maturation protein FdhE
MNKNIQNYISGACPNCGNKEGEETYFEETNGQIVRNIYCPNCDSYTQAVYLIHSVNFFQEEQE